MNNRFDNINDIQKFIIRDLFKLGKKADPRGLNTLENLSVSFCLENPRNRLLSLEGRKWNLPLAIGEMCWHSNASDDVSQLSYYANQWNNFAESDGKVAGSCYGKNAFTRNHENIIQWTAVKALLKNDRNTRRAILFFNLSPHRLDIDAIDVSCISSIQFLIRSNKLQTFVHMRSNDAIWGLPYDVFLCTWLQEKMALELDIEIGEYHHNATSMHLYERHFDLAETLLNAKPLCDSHMPSMTNINELETLIQSEKLLRLGGGEPKCKTEYWRDLENILLSFSNAKSRNYNLHPVTFTHHPYKKLMSAYANGRYS